MSGVIEELLVEDGSTVQPGKPICKIRVGAGGGAAKKAEPEAPKPSSEAAPPPKPAEVPQSAPPPPPKPSAPISSTPVGSVKPAAPTATDSDVTVGTRKENRVKMNRMRLRIAQRLKDAQNTYAMLTTFNEIDMRSKIKFNSISYLFLNFYFSFH